ncbi:hypothetical protein M426DRAFT_24191 [Hypoxylon sp. CI-4A]|nr:hypothetical protein M426DRAFT_24191 [Hypoxylon sp. CI-4A]
MSSVIVIDDYYGILGVDRTADAEDLKAAWRQLVRIKHPDKNLGNPDATAEFQLLESAYSTLTDPERRRAYDHLRFACSSEPLRRASAATAAPPPPPSVPTTAPDKYTSDYNEHDARARFEHLLAEKEAQEAGVSKLRLHLFFMQWELDQLHHTAERDLDEHQDDFKRRSPWKKIIATLVPTSNQRHQLEEERRSAEWRRVDWETALRIKSEQVMRQWEVFHGLEANLRHTEDAINSLVQQEIEEDERYEHEAEW